MRKTKKDSCDPTSPGTTPYSWDYLLQLQLNVWTLERPLQTSLDLLKTYLFTGSLLLSFQGTADAEFSYAWSIRKDICYHHKHLNGAMSSQNYRAKGINTGNIYCTNLIRCLHHQYSSHCTGLKEISQLHLCKFTLTAVDSKVPLYTLKSSPMSKICPKGVTLGT